MPLLETVKVALSAATLALFVVFLIYPVRDNVFARRANERARRLEVLMVKTLAARYQHPETFAEVLSDAEDELEYLRPRIVEERVQWNIRNLSSGGKRLPEREVVGNFKAEPRPVIPNPGETHEQAVRRSFEHGFIKIQGYQPADGKMPPPPKPKAKMPIHELKDTPVEDRTWRGKDFVDLTPSQQSQAIADWMTFSVRDDLLVRWINDDADSRWDIFRSALEIRGAAQ